MSDKQILEAKILDLKSKLYSSESNIGDWKVVKCYEAALADKVMPYDLDDLLAKRQAVRDEINQLQAEVEALEE